jgi:hypothetical protein
VAIEGQSTCPRLLFLVTNLFIGDFGVKLARKKVAIMEEAPLNSVESLELMLAIAKEEGIQVRSEWLSGVRGGLVRVGEQPYLFVDESLSVPEQLAQVRSALGALDWSETSHADAMAQLLVRVAP